MLDRRSGQKGMTLVELLVVMAISGLLAAVLVPSIFQFITGTQHVNVRLTAVHEIEKAARWICQDLMMAQSSNLVEGAEPMDNLSLTWVERYELGDVAHSASYWLLGNEIKRDYDGAVTTVAQYISDVQFSQEGGLIKVAISSTPEETPKRTEQRLYKIYLRPVEG